MLAKQRFSTSEAHAGIFVTVTLRRILTPTQGMFARVKVALYPSRFMDTRLSATEEGCYDSPVTESTSASFLRRKMAQGKTQFGKPDDSKK